MKDRNFIKEDLKTHIEKSKDLSKAFQPTEKELDRVAEMINLFYLNKQHPSNYGSFLRSVYRNSLIHASRHADPTNLKYLGLIGLYLFYNPKPPENHTLHKREGEGEGE